jgi:hypothetical protein
VKFTRVDIIRAIAMTTALTLSACVPAPTGDGTGLSGTIIGAGAASDRAFTVDEIAEENFVSCVPGTGILEILTHISPMAIIVNLDGVRSLNLDAELNCRVNELLPFTAQMIPAPPPTSGAIWQKLHQTHGMSAPSKSGRSTSAGRLHHRHPASSMR